MEKRQAGSGVTIATPRAAPARWPAYVPRRERASSVERSRMAMKCQGCVFLEDCARPPAHRIRCNASSGSGRGSNSRTARLRRMASTTSIEGLLEERPHRRTGSDMAKVVSVIHPPEAGWSSIDRLAGGLGQSSNIDHVGVVGLDAAVLSQLLEIHVAHGPAVFAFIVGTEVPLQDVLHASVTPIDDGLSGLQHKNERARNRDPAGHAGLLSGPYFARE